MVSVASRNGPMPVLGHSALHLHTCVLFLTRAHLLLLEFSEGEAFTHRSPVRCPQVTTMPPSLCKGTDIFLLTGQLDEFNLALVFPAMLPNTGSTQFPLETLRFHHVQ